MASRRRIFTGTIALLSVAMGLGGCASNPKPGSDMVGTWTGAYRWDRGSAYPVTLVVRERSLTGKVTVAFTATESAGTCALVQVKGTLHVPSRKVVLDEVDTKCESLSVDPLDELITSPRSAARTTP